MEKYTEPVGLTVTLYSCIWEELISNLGRDTGYPDWWFWWFSPILQADAGMVPRLGFDRIFPAEIRTKRLPNTNLERKRVAANPPQFVFRHWSCDWIKRYVV
jgi:hypothetical protein